MSEESQHDRHQRIAFSKEVLARKKYKASPANELTDEVIKYVKSIGGAARRVNSSGQWDEVAQKWRPSGMKRGFEDIDATIPVTIRTHGMGYFKIGLKMAIEIKIKRDTASDHQINRRQELIDAGAVYIFVSNLQEAIDNINSFITNVKEVLDVAQAC